MDLRILILSAIVAAASAAPLSSSQCARQCDGIQPFETQKTYKYSYSIETSTFVNESSNTQDQPRDASVLKIQCNVEVVAQSSCEVFLRVTDVNVRERSSSGQEVTSPKKTEMKNALEAHWLRFAFQDGMVKEVCPEDGEEKWTLNIKRAILSALQIPVPQIPQDVKQPMMSLETDVTGTCPVYLSSTMTGIRKDKNFEGCKDRIILDGSIQAIKLNDYAPVFNIMSSTQTCEQSIRGPFIIQSSSCSERHKVNPFSKHDTGVLTIVKQELNFLEERSGSNAPSSYNQERQTTIIFEHQMKDQQPDAREAKNQLFSYCQSFTEDDKQTERPEYFAKLVEQLDNIDDAGFMSVRQYATDATTCRSNREQVKKFFIDAVAMCESTACINGMVGMLATPDLVQSSVAELWVSSLPFIRKPTSEMIPTLMNLVKVEPIQPSVYLAVSSLIHNFCIREGVDCNQDTNFQNALDYFENALDHDCSPSGTITNDMRLKLIVSLKSIGNIGNIGTANYLSGTLTRCMQRTNDIDIRLAAIEAFRRLPCDEEERNELTNLYKNRVEDTELRIASYRAMMQCASEELLEVVVETMEVEEDGQVGSFVLSHLKNLNETSDPQKKQLKEVLLNSEVMGRFSRDIRKISRNYEVAYYNDKLMSGASFESNVIFSDKSFLPRSLSLNATAEVFGYAINMFEIGGRMEGMQRKLESMFGPTGYFKKASEDETSNTLMQTLMQMFGPMTPPMPQQQQQQDRNKRNVDQNRMDNIVNQFDIPQEDKPMASLYMKIMGNEIAFMDYDAIMERFNQWKQSANLMQVLGKLATDQTFDMSRSSKMVKVTTCLPTVAGLALSLNVDGNSVTQVSASGRLNVLGMMMAPRNLHIEGSIRPSVALELSTTLQVDAFHTRTGLNHIARLHSDSILDGALIIENGNSLRVKFNVPEETQTIVDVSSNIFRLHQEDKTEILGDPQSQFSDEVCTAELTAKYVGVRICSDITFPATFTTIDSPRMIVSGPAQVKMTVAKVDPHLTSFELDVAKMTNKEEVNGETVLTDIFRLTVGTPNTPTQRTYSVNYSLNRNTWQMILDLQSPWKTARVEANTVNEDLHRKLDLTLSLNPAASDEKTFRMVAEKMIEYPSDGVIRHVPRFEFTGPKGNQMQLTGSVINNEPQRRTDVDLQILENSQRLISLNGPITRTEGTKKSAYGIEWTVEGRYVEGKLTGQVNRNKDAYTIDIDLQKKMNGQLVETPWAAISLIFGSNRDDIMFRLQNEVEFTDYPDYNYHFEIESVGDSVMNHENTVKLCYNGIACNTDTKVVIVQNNTLAMTQTEISQNFIVRINHPAQSKEYEIVQSFRKAPEGLNASFSIVDDQVHKTLFSSALKHKTGAMGKLSFEMATEKRFFSTNNEWHMHNSGRIDFVSTLRRELQPQKTSTVTFAYAPTMNMHDVDLDIVFCDNREINIGSRVENNLDQGMLDFDFTIDRFGVQNWVSLNMDYRDNSDDTKWEHRASVDLQTPLVSLRNQRLEGGLKREGNVYTHDMSLRYSPDEPKVGFEVILTNNSNAYDTHGQIDVVVTTVSHTITLSSNGGYQKKTDKKACNLAASVNFRSLQDQTEGKTFGFEMNYGNSTNESRIRHGLDARGYAPDHEVSMDTWFKLTPGQNNLMSSFDFKWVKDQQGLTLTCSLQNTSDSQNTNVAITGGVQLPSQNLVINLNHARRENYYDRSLIVTLNNEEKANMAFTYTRTITGPQTVCRPNVNILVNGKRVIWDAALTRVQNVPTHLESSITHDADPEPSFSVLMDITPMSQANPEEGFDLTFNVVNKYMTGYDTSFTWSRMLRNTYATPVGHNTMTLSMDGTQKLGITFSVAVEAPANVPAANIPAGTRMDQIPPTFVVDFGLSFPEVQDVVFRNLAVNARYSCLACGNQVQLMWGNKGDDETITIADSLTLTGQSSGGYDVSITHPFSLPMLYPTFTLGADFNIAELSSDVKFEITTADQKKRAIQVVYTNTSLTPPLKQTAEIILSRTDKDDIKVKGELKALTPDAIADFTLTCEYSNIPAERLEINTKLVNRSDANLERKAKELEIHVDHPVSNVEIDLFISTNNDTRDISVGLEGTIRVGTEHGAVTLEASWDKRDKQYRIHHIKESLESARMLERETQEMTLTGTFEDKSYGEYKIYEMDMMNDFNGQRIPSFFKFDTHDMEVEYDINFNPDDRSDYYRFKAGYLNSSAIMAKIDTRRGLEHTVNASVLFYLQAPKVLYTKINWHPQWPKDLKESACDMWNQTTARLIARENARFYRNKTVENFLAQWEVFKLRNADVPGTALQLVGALQGKLESAMTSWATRKQNMQTKWTTFTNDINTQFGPKLARANATWELSKGMMPLVQLKLETETRNYFEAAAIALEAYKSHCLLPMYGSMMMNVAQIKTNAETDIANIKLQALAQVMDLNTKMNESAEALRLDMVVTSVKLITWYKQVNQTVYDAMMERYENMKTNLMRNPILVDVIRWGILVQDLVPIKQWNETAKALYREFSTSNDFTAIREFWEQIGQLVATRRAAMAEYLRLNPRNTTWMKDRMLEALIAYSESQQNYKLLKADLENGEIITLLYLQEEWKNLQSLPETYTQNLVVEEFKGQLAGMARLLERQINTQIMDPQLQELGIFEAAYILNMLNSQPNMTKEIMGKLAYDKGVSQYFRVMRLLKMIQKPKNWIPPYDATAMIVHNQHYMTFDRRFYEFAGRCTYLLAHDFLDGNFSIYVDYSDSDSSTTTKKLIVQQDDQVYTIYPDLRVTDGSRIKDLPFRMGNITITRDHNRVKVHNEKGVTVICTSPYEICHVSMSGWYYGQTAGLLGTYDYQAQNDFTLPNGDVADDIDRFTRNWEVSTSCSTTTNRAHRCPEVDPALEQNALCRDTFLSTESRFRPMFDYVDPEPFYQMCVNDMCGLNTEEERKEHICEVMKAYLSQNPGCPKRISLPSHCIKCETSSGTVIESDGMPKKIQNPEPEADVVIVVEEKRCAEGNIADNLHDVVIRLDTELRRNNIMNNRFALVGFGGDDIHDLPHPHTIDGSLFNNATRFRLGVEALEFGDDGNNDTLAAIMKAAKYPWRAGASKNIILVSCSDCQYKETSYGEVADTLIKRGIQLNMLLRHDLNIKAKKNKSSKEKVYGFDDLAVYTAKMAGDATLKGDQSLRQYINEPLNKCTVLAMETNGSVFDVNGIAKKGFQEVFVLRMVKQSQPLPCQLCRCSPNEDWVGESVCERCEPVTATDAFMQAIKGNIGNILGKAKDKASALRQ